VSAEAGGGRMLRAAVLASGQIVASGAAIITSAVLARLLSQADYGTYKQTLLAYGMAAPLLLMALPKVLYVFVPRQPERARGLLWENLILLCLAASIFTGALLLGGAEVLARRFNNPDLAHTLRLYAPYPLFAFPVLALGGCLMVAQQVRTVAMFNVAGRLALLVPILLISFVFPTPEAAVLAAVGGAALMLLPGLWLMLRATRGTQGHVTRAGLGEQLRFALPLGLASAIGAFNLTLDKLVVSALTTPEQYAIYANGAFEIPLIAVITGSVTAVMLPELSRLLAEGKGPEALVIWRQSTVQSATLLLPAMCLLFGLAEPLIEVLYSARYLESATPFRLYLLALPARIAIFGAIMMAAGQGRVILVRAIGSLVLGLPLSLVLVHYLGPLGAILATLAVLYAWTTPLNLRSVAAACGVPTAQVLPFGALARILAVAVLGGIVLIPHAFLGLPALVDLVIFGPLYVIVTAGLLLKLGLVDPTLARRVGNKLRRLARGKR
jgi:O-antigen/teichoic acid export membrane protein